MLIRVGLAAESTTNGRFSSRRDDPLDGAEHVVELADDDEVVVVVVLQEQVPEVGARRVLLRDVDARSRGDHHRQERAPVDRDLPRRVTVGERRVLVLDHVAGRGAAPERLEREGDHVEASGRPGARVGEEPDRAFSRRRGAQHRAVEPRARARPPAAAQRSWSSWSWTMRSASRLRRTRAEHERERADDEERTHRAEASDGRHSRTGCTQPGSTIGSRWERWPSGSGTRPTPSC